MVMSMLDGFAKKAKIMLKITIERKRASLIYLLNNMDRQIVMQEFFLDKNKKKMMKTSEHKFQSFQEAFEFLNRNIFVFVEDVDNFIKKEIYKVFIERKS